MKRRTEEKEVEDEKQDEEKVRYRKRSRLVDVVRGESAVDLNVSVREALPHLSDLAGRQSLHQPRQVRRASRDRIQEEHRFGRAGRREMAGAPLASYPP